MRTILVLMLTLVIATGYAYAQEAASKAAGQPGSLRSITLPVIHTELKEGEGRTTVETRCAICHSTDYIPMQPKLTKAQWTATVNKMIKVFGAPVTPEEAEKIVSYLVTNYGTGN
jgi:sulfite dehydrogenase (cytochrome) subunit B